MKYIILIPLFIMLAACSKETSTSTNPIDNNTQGGNLEIGTEAPDFELTDKDGNPVRLSDYRGKVVFIDFWASWCNICVKAIPEVKQIYNKYKNKDFEMIGVSVDYKQEEWKQAITAYGMDWIHVYDEKAPSDKNVASLKYRVSGIPTVAIIDKEGKIRYLSYHNKIQIEKIIDQYID